MADSAGLNSQGMRSSKQKALATATREKNVDDDAETTSEEPALKKQKRGKEKGGDLSMKPPAQQQEDNEEKDEDEGEQQQEECNKATAASATTITITITIKGSPRLDLKEKAKDAFADLYFYNGEEPSEKRNEVRADKFQNQTVDEFFTSIKERDNLNKAVSGTGLDSYLIVPFWEKTRETAEQQLKGQVLVCGEEEEIQKLIDDYVDTCANGRSRHSGGPDAGGGRTQEIYIVLGSSGSGKTSFCINDLVKKSTVRKHFTFYCCLGSSKDNDQQFIDMLITDTKFLIRSKCTKQAYPEERTEPLDMDLTVILDEAYAAKKHLCKLDQLQRIRREYKEKIATSVRLVLAGTGYDEVCQAMNSQQDVFKYDMKPWDTKRAVAMLKKKVESQDRKAARACLRKYAILRRLCTNPRSASFLFQKTNGVYFERLASGFVQSYMSTLIESVVIKYLASNGLRSLTPQKGRQVARGVLAALDYARKNMDNPSYVPPICCFLGSLLCYAVYRTTMSAKNLRVCSVCVRNSFRGMFGKGANQIGVIQIHHASLIATDGEVRSNFARQKSLLVCWKDINP